MSSVPDSVRAFVAATAALPVRSLQEIRRAITAVTIAGNHYAARAPKLSAADHSALWKLVQDAFAPRATELRELKSGALRAATSTTMLAAQAIWKPHRLTPAQFDAHLAMFRAVGVEVLEPEAPAVD